MLNDVEHISMGLFAIRKSLLGGFSCLIFHWIDCVLELFIDYEDTCISYLVGKHFLQNSVLSSIL